MSDPATHWVEKLAAKPLPALREGIQQVRVMLDSPSVNHIRLSNFIEFDPGFCVHVFRAMNRLPKRPKETITKLSNALPMLGMERMSRATRELEAAESVLKKRPLAGLIDCFSRAAHAALYAQALAQHRDAEPLTEFAVAALLHDIGEMALWVHDPDLMEAIKLRTAGGEPRDRAAREILGCTIEQISDGISRAWELPALTIEAQDLTNSYREAPLIVMLAAALARATAGTWNTPAARDHIELFGEFLDMPDDTATGYVHALAVDAARRLSDRGFVLPAFSLIQMQAVVYPRAAAQAAESPARSPVRTGTQAPASPEAQPGPVPAAAQVRVTRESAPALALRTKQPRAAARPQTEPAPEQTTEPTASPRPMQADNLPAKAPSSPPRARLSSSRRAAESPAVHRGQGAAETPAPGIQAQPGSPTRPRIDPGAVAGADRPAPEPAARPGSDHPAAPRNRLSPAPQAEPGPGSRSPQAPSARQPAPRPAGNRDAPAAIPAARAQTGEPNPQAAAQSRNAAKDRPAAAARRSAALETISGTLREMLGKQRLRRLMFAVLTPDRKGLKCGLAMDDPARPSLKGFSLGFERANLFSALLKKPQIFWLNNDNKTKYLPAIPSETLGVLSADGFLLMSIFIKNRPVGVLYADSGNSDAPLTADSYAVFKTACQRLVKTLNGQS